MEFTLSGRVSDEDDMTDIEMRSATEKYTVGTVDDRFAALFLAAPELLEACIAVIGACPEHMADASFVPIVKMCRAAIAKAKGESK